MTDHLPDAGKMTYVTIPKAADLIGLTEKAIRRKIESGVWIEGREYRRAPDGRVYISLEGVTSWVEGSKSAKPAFASASA